MTCSGSLSVDMIVAGAGERGSNVCNAVSFCHPSNSIADCVRYGVRGGGIYASMEVSMVSSTVGCGGCDGSPPIVMNRRDML